MFHTRGSLLELETQVLIAGRLEYIDSKTTDRLCNESAEIASTLNGLVSGVPPCGAMIGRPDSPLFPTPCPQRPMRLVVTARAAPTCSPSPHNDSDTPGRRTPRAA
ncbi:MAG: hypothetical protein DMG70_14880 [Acidobacteria bacterium]|nr:MAG: hypothetical protein DMG70_14880 [Acidobacteriota bacterium]PYY04310.1 MAG: hypothetical protein DMG69_30830 [Acidobacteriota bacterium]